jgi:hypothetical protein
MLKAAEEKKKADEASTGARKTATPPSVAANNSKQRRQVLHGSMKDIPPPDFFLSGRPRLEAGLSSVLERGAYIEDCGPGPGGLELLLLEAAGHGAREQKIKKRRLG